MVNPMDGSPPPMEGNHADEEAAQDPLLVHPLDDDDSWEDSERFEEDSLGSWYTDPESLCQNWRGWAAGANHVLPYSYTGGLMPSTSRHVETRKSSLQRANLMANESGSKIPTLLTLAAKCVSAHCTFDDVDQFCAASPLASYTVATNIQLELAYWCFPSREDDIRLYSCLAHGNAEEFQRGEILYRTHAVKDILQIGFHLTATVVDIHRSTGNAQQPINGGLVNEMTNKMRTMSLANIRPPPEQLVKVAITVDRCKITSCQCTGCPQSTANNTNGDAQPSTWCCHAVAVCLHRMYNIKQVQFRVPISESLDILDRMDAGNRDMSKAGQTRQLKKFAQYLISELPREFLPIAQRLLDELLNRDSHMRLTNGAPDPTAGASRDDAAGWCLDEDTLSMNIRRILNKFCMPSPTVFSDVTCLSSHQPAVATEWQSLLRPLRSREPEGLWNLLNIVREMFRRNDANATTLLHIITEKCISYTQVVVWWYNTKLAQSGRYPISQPLFSSTTASSSNSGKSGLASNVQNAQFGCTSLCEQVVSAWRMAALNPRLCTSERQQLGEHLVNYHRTVLEILWRVLSKQATNATNPLSNAPQRHFQQNQQQQQQQQQQSATQLQLSVAGYGRLLQSTAQFDLDAFPGFRSAVEACQIKWNGIQIPGIDVDKTKYDALTISTCNERAPVMFSPNLPILRPKSQPSSSRTPVHSPAEHEQQSVDVVLDDNASETTSSRESGQGSSRPSPTPANQPYGRTPEPLDPRTMELNYLLDMYLAQEDAQQNGANVAGVESVQPAPNIPCPVPAIIAELETVTPKNSKFATVYTQCEALDIHGFGENAADIAETLALQMIHDPPNLMRPTPGPIAPPKILWSQKMVVNKQRKKKGSSNDTPLIPHPDTMALCRETNEYFQQAHFLIDVLIRHKRTALAYELGICTLRTPRQPVTTKFLEVHNYHLEHEIVALLIDLPVTDVQMSLLRKEAHNLLTSTTQTSTVLPFCLASFIFDSICTPNVKSIAAVCSQTDASLAFDAALATLSMQSRVSELSQPLLCERMRRERGDLALNMLLYCKDSQERVAQVLYRLLDADMHKLYAQHMQCTQCIFHILGGHAHAHVKQHAHAEEQQTNINNATSSSADACEQTCARVASLRLTGDAATSSSTTSSHPSSASSMIDVTDGSTVQKSSTSTDTNIKTNIKVTSRYRRTGGELVLISCAPNTPSEAHAHYMHELAKRVLTEAGGNHTPAIFNAQHNQHANNANLQIVPNGGVHRQLQLSAFLIGLYSLGLLNKVTPTWLSRTYSSQVSWITSQAIEIGRIAIRLLVDMWPNHLTPSEVATLADKASQTREPGIVTAAAELALSVLPHAHALGQAEINRALAQCKEQNTAMLERACLTVEQAAKDYGVYPEVVFGVAQRWHTMYNEQIKSEIRRNGAATTSVEMQGQAPSSAHSTPGYQPLINNYVAPAVQPIILPANHNNHQSQFQQPGYMMYNGVPVQQQNMSVPPPNMHPQIVHQQFQQGLLPIPGANNFYQPPPQQQQCPNAVVPPYPVPQNYRGVPLHNSHSAPNLNPIPTHMLQRMPSNIVQQQQQSEITATNAEANTTTNDSKVRYLYNAYRVGMLAMDLLGKRIDEDRSYVNKFSQNPPYREQVEWLFSTARQLGHAYTYQFCISASQSILSPFLLWHLVLEASQIFGQPQAAVFHAPHTNYTHLPPGVMPITSTAVMSSNTNQASSSCTSVQPPWLQLNPKASTTTLRQALAFFSVTTSAPNNLLLKCLTMFYAAAAQKMSHTKFQTSDAEEICNLAREAKIAFHMLPYNRGPTLFNDYMQFIRAQRACKKDVWGKICAAVSGNQNLQN